MATNAEFKLLQAWFKKLGLTKYKTITKNQLNQLKEFDLRGITIDDVSLIQHIPQVKKLYLQNSVLPEDINLLLEAKELERIYLTNCQLSEEQLAVFAKFEKLNRIDLTNTNITDLTVFENHAALETLHITNMNVSKLPVLPNLKVLHAKGVVLENIDEIQSLCPNLTRLDYDDSKEQ